MRFLVSALSGLVGLIVLAGVGLFLWHPDGVIKAINTLLHPTRNSTAYGSALVVPSGQGKSGDIQINLQGLTSRLHYVVTLNKDDLPPWLECRSSSSIHLFLPFLRCTRKFHYLFI